MQTRKRTSSTVPFGWSIHPSDSGYLIENLEEQDALKFIKERQGNLSLRQIAGVIEARTGRKLTPRGVQKVLNRNY